MLLPAIFQKDTDRFYPVVYFHDGQNVFLARSPISDTLENIPAIKRNPDISRMIVVAIDNDGMGRMDEYHAAGSFQESLFQGSSLAVRVWSMPSLSWRWLSPYR